MLADAALKVFKNVNILYVSACSAFRGLACYSDGMRSVPIFWHSLYLATEVGAVNQEVVLLLGVPFLPVSCHSAYRSFFPVNFHSAKSQVFQYGL